MTDLRSFVGVKPLLLAATMLMTPNPSAAAPAFARMNGERASARQASRHEKAVAPEREARRRTAQEPVVSEDVPIPGGTAAFARAIGIAAPDRVRFVAEVVRLVYAESSLHRFQTESPFRRLIAYFKVAGRGDNASTDVPTDLVPIPLPAVLWSQAVFHRPVAPAGLFAAIMSDSKAALLAYGLAALDDETLQFLVDHPAVVTRLYEHDACVFAAFAEQLHIHNNRVVPPGGDRAVPLWEAVLGERVAQPDRFVRELFARDEGRAAYLYDTIGHLDSARAAFALGLWIKDAGMRIDRFHALASAARSGFREWRVQQFPFTRPPNDLVLMLSRVHVDASGAPGFPAWRTVWAQAFDDGDVPGELKPLEDGAVIDAAWLAEAIGARAVPRGRSASISSGLASVRSRRPTRRHCLTCSRRSAPFPDFAC